MGLVMVIVTVIVILTVIFTVIITVIIILTVIVTVIVIVILTVLFTAIVNRQSYKVNQTCHLPQIVPPPPFILIQRPSVIEEQHDALPILLVGTIAAHDPIMHMIMTSVSL